MLTESEVATDKSPRNLEMNHLIHSQPKDRNPPACLYTSHTDATTMWQCGVLQEVFPQKSRAGLGFWGHCGILIWIPKKEKQY